MPVMDIRKMRMVVANRIMQVRMAVCRTGRYLFGMLMLMLMLMLVVLIMSVAMGVLQRLVFMHVLMLLGEVQPDAEHHECRGHPEQQRN